MILKELLSPTLHHGYRTVIIEYLFDYLVITHSTEVCTPEKTHILTCSPLATCSFSHKIVVFLSFGKQHYEPKLVGCRRAPPRVRSKRYSPVYSSMLVALIDSSSSTGCIRIQPISSALQSVLRHVGLLGS